MIHFIHGIHTSDPAVSVGKLAPFFEEAGFSTKVHKYGYAWAIGTRFMNNGRAKEIGKFVQPEDIIVGHSNGGCLAWMIANQQPVKGLILINPALDDDAVFDTRLQWVDVYFNHTDGAVPWANIFVGHPFGDMGQEGYTGQDKKVTNINCCNGHKDLLPCVDGHSAIFKEPNLTPWAGFMILRTRSRYGINTN